MARSLAVEWAQQKIRVNCIRWVLLAEFRGTAPTNPSPGYMLTPLTKTILDNDPVLRDTWVSKIPQVSISVSRGVSRLGYGRAGHRFAFRPRAASLLLGRVRARQPSYRSMLHASGRSSIPIRSYSASLTLLFRSHYALMI